MGKTHTLRRAIARNPQAFIMKMRKPAAKSAQAYSSNRQRNNGRWLPVSPMQRGSYRAYVRAVLRSLGHMVE